MQSWVMEISRREGIIELVAIELIQDGKVISSFRTLQLYEIRIWPLSAGSRCNIYLIRKLSSH